MLKIFKSIRLYIHSDRAGAIEYSKFGAPGDGKGKGDATSLVGTRLGYVCRVPNLDDQTIAKGENLESICAPAGRHPTKPCRDPQTKRKGG